jgi:DNA-binding LacI/PurR family transcriptional regulator
MAYRATEKLLEVLEGKKPYTPGFYEVPAELIIRESTVKK